MNNILDESQIQLQIHIWDDLEICPSILRGIYAYGYEKPSPIQQKAILPMIAGKNLIAQAQSGTGKTAAFTIGSLTKVDLSSNSTQVLIMCPTRELASQITSVVSNISQMMDGLRVKTIVGGTSISDDVEDMRARPPHVIVGCPGRIYDMIQRKHIATSTLKMVVLDEADEMLSEGFSQQTQGIFRELNEETQIALFSATLPQNIKQITQNFMNSEPVYISVKSDSLTLEGIKQYFIALENDEQKFNTLKDLYEHISVSQCIIYCNSVQRVIDLYTALHADNFPVCYIHSKMGGAEREYAFKEFRTGAARVLISSNVTARGIDIQQVSVVINFDLSRDIHTYLHRIGRSGRWGRKGTGINFVTKRDVYTLREIERYYATQIEELPANFSV